MDAGVDHGKELHISALHLAAFHRCPQVIMLLLAAGAHANVSSEGALIDTADPDPDPDQGVGAGGSQLAPDLTNKTVEEEVQVPVPSSSSLRSSSKARTGRSSSEKSSKAGLGGNTPSADSLRLRRWEVTPLNIAVWNTDLACVDALLDGGAIPSELCLCSAAKAGVTKLLERLLTKVRSSGLQRSDGTVRPLLYPVECPVLGQCLLLAASGGHTKSLRVLLEAGADIRVTDHSGNSALHLAARIGSLSCCGERPTYTYHIHMPHTTDHMTHTTDHIPQIT